MAKDILEFLFVTAVNWALEVGSCSRLRFPFAVLMRLRFFGLMRPGERTRQNTARQGNKKYKKSRRLEGGLGFGVATCLRYILKLLGLKPLHSGRDDASLEHFVLFLQDRPIWSY